MKVSTSNDAVLRQDSPPTFPVTAVPVPAAESSVRPVHPLVSGGEVIDDEPRDELDTPSDDDGLHNYKGGMLVTKRQVTTLLF